MCVFGVVLPPLTLVVSQPKRHPRNAKTCSVHVNDTYDEIVAKLNAGLMAN